MQGLANKTVLAASVAMTLSVAVNLLFLQEAAGPRARERGDGEARWLQTSAGASGGAQPIVLNAKPTAETDAAGVIRAVQRELNGRNYDAGQPDGVAGLVTRAAVMAYEFDYDLPLTATPSEDLLGRIVLGSSTAQQGGRSAKAPTQDAEGVIRLVKEQLAALGYQPGRVDGALSPDAERAIREFETDQRLPETGRISAPMMSRLLRLQGQTASVAPVKPQSPKPAGRAQGAKEARR